MEFVHSWVSAPAGVTTVASNEGPTVFEFMNAPDRRAAQRHVKREFWRKRREKNERQESARSKRKLAPRSLGSVEISKAEVVELNGVTKTRAEVIEEVTNADEEVPELSRTMCQDMSLVHTGPMVLFNDLDIHTTWWDTPTPQEYKQLSPYMSLGETELDPFNHLILSREDQGLLHHWVNTYAYQAFGQPSDANFALLRDLYIPINLSHSASVHSVLAHSASHLAFLRQEKVSIQALKHKMVAVRLVNEALGNPVTAISDDTFCAVLRLLTYERYWGTEDIWMFHRRGLNQMIKLRGGLSTFADNWRLEARIHIVAQMSVPKWHSVAFRNSTTPSASSNPLQRPHSNFVNFFSNITAPKDTAHRYPSIERATSLLRSSAHHPDDFFQIQETSRIMSLFYVAVLSKDSLRSHTDLRWLDGFLAQTEMIWRSSVEMLRWLLLQVTGRGVGEIAPNGVDEVSVLDVVGEAVRWSPWRGMEDRLLAFPQGGVEEEE